MWGIKLNFKIMKEIKLTQGKVALVDDASFEELNKNKWCASLGNKTFYAVRGFKKPNGKWSTKAMHRVIFEESKLEIDHRDGNGLNNQKDNLRPCDHSTNNMNKGKLVNNTSGFKGVTWNKSIGKWQAQIKLNKKPIYLGVFPTKEEAYKAYCEAGKKYHGEFFHS